MTGLSVGLRWLSVSQFTHHLLFAGSIARISALSVRREWSTLQLLTLRMSKSDDRRENLAGQDSVNEDSWTLIKRGGRSERVLGRSCIVKCMSIDVKRLAKNIPKLHVHT